MPKDKKGRKPKDTVMSASNVKYINGDKNAGIVYDWDLLRADYKALNCPDVYYSPVHCPFETCNYFMGFSARSIGKSTGWLLFGMLMHERYGTRIMYLRQREEDVAPKISGEMFNAIRYNGYIPKITKNRWNWCEYKSRKWYYANIDDEGNVIEQDAEPFCHICVVTKHERYKSSMNVPTGDLIIFDEFINRYYFPDEFVMFCDLIKSIARDRQSPKIAMLANNTDKTSEYFFETETYDTVAQMNPGDEKRIITSGGTAIHVEYITGDQKKMTLMQQLSKLYFGFKNKRLSSITGAGWALKPRQRIPKGDYEYIVNNVYISHNERLLALDIINHEKLGICVYMHWATRTHTDSVILTQGDRVDERYMYGMGEGRIKTIYERLIAENRVYYSSNDVANFFDNYYYNLPSLLTKRF